MKKTLKDILAEYGMIAVVVYLVLFALVLSSTPLPASECSVIATSSSDITETASQFRWFIAFSVNSESIWFIAGCGRG